MHGKTPFRVSGVRGPFNDVGLPDGGLFLVGDAPQMAKKWFIEEPVHGAAFQAAVQAWSVTQGEALGMEFRRRGGKARSIPE